MTSSAGFPPAEMAGPRIVRRALVPWFGSGTRGCAGSGVVEVRAGGLAAGGKLVGEPVEQRDQARVLLGIPVLGQPRDAFLPGQEQGVERVLPRFGERYRLFQVRPQR